MLEIALNAIPTSGFKRVAHIVIGFLREELRKSKRRELTEK
jgi:hypothetical protein